MVLEFQMAEGSVVPKHVTGMTDTRREQILQALDTFCRSRQEKIQTTRDTEMEDHAKPIQFGHKKIMCQKKEWDNWKNDWCSRCKTAKKRIGCSLTQKSKFLEWIQYLVFITLMLWKGYGNSGARTSRFEIFLQKMSESIEKSKHTYCNLGTPQRQGFLSQAYIKPTPYYKT